MSDSPPSGPPASDGSAGAARWRRVVEGVGGAVIGWVDRCGETVRFVGDMTDLLGQTLRWVFRSVFVPGVRL